MAEGHHAARAYLPADHLRQMLADVPSIGDKSDRRAALELLTGLPAYRRGLRTVLTAVFDCFARLWGVHAEPPRYTRLPGHIAAAGLPRVALRSLGVIRNQYRREQAFQQIVPHLPDSLVRDALEIARNIGWDALSAVASRLPDDLAQQLLQQMTHAEDRCILSTEKVIASLIPRLGALGHAEQGYAAARDLRWDLNRNQAMAGLILFLQEPSVREVLTSMNTLHEGKKRDCILARAAFRLAQLGSRAEAMRLAVTIATGAERIIALNGISLIVAALELAEGEPLLREALPQLARRGRAALLFDVVALAPLIRSLGGTEAIKGTVAAMRHTGVWWT